MDETEELEVFVKIKKKKIFFWGGGLGERSGWGVGGESGWGGGGGQGGCESRIEFFWKIQKKKIGGGGGWVHGGVRVGGRGRVGGSEWM